MQIDRVIQLGEQYKDLPVNQYCLHTLGIDPGFGSSKMALVLTEHLKKSNIVRVIYAEEFERPNPQQVAVLCFDFRKYMNTWFIVDGSNRGFITELKIKFGEDTNYEKDDIDPENMKVIPVNFSTEHKNMLSHLHLMINKEYLAIPEKFDKLIVSLRTAYAKEYSLDKEQTSYDDMLDALRLSLKGYNIT